MQSVLLLSMTSLHNTCRTGWICRAHPSRQFPLASLCCGYNVITIPLSPKARLCLQEGKAKREPLQRANKALSPMCFILLWSFCSLSGGHRAACTYTYGGASQDVGFVTRPQQPPPHLSGFTMCCFASSPFSAAEPASQAVHAQLQEPCP